jgi:hypothetical protein
MPYSPPLGNAADFQFRGPYSPREGNDADLNFELGVLRAQGFRAARFGTPTGPISFKSTRFGIPSLWCTTTGATTTNLGAPRLIQPGTATGFLSTTFGTAIAPKAVTGFLAVRFGTPNSPYLQEEEATGWLTTGIGNPRRVQFAFAYSVPRTTVVPQAYTAFNQTCVAASRANPSAGLGRPTYRTRPPLVNNVASTAVGWLATQFGTARSPYVQAAEAQGFGSTRWGWPRGSALSGSARLGVPTAQFVLAAAALNSTALGTPLLMRRVQALTTGAFGTPTALLRYAATGRTHARLGAPAAFLGGYKAAAINTGRRFGQPRATNNINRTTTGWIGSNLGAPSSLQTHRAPAMASTMQFGTPLLRRSPAC